MSDSNIIRHPTDPFAWWWHPDFYDANITIDRPAHSHVCVDCGYVGAFDIAQEDWSKRFAHNGRYLVKIVRTLRCQSCNFEYDHISYMRWRRDGFTRVRPGSISKSGRIADD